MLVSQFVKGRRAVSGLSQRDLAEKAGVGLRFVRDLEQGKGTLRMDKVNQVLQLFGFELGPTEIMRGGREEDQVESPHTPVNRKKNEKS